MDKSITKNNVLTLLPKISLCGNHEPVMMF